MTAETCDEWTGDDFALEDLLLGKRWAFGNAASGELISPEITLESGGKLCGHDNVNESAWRVADGGLEFLTDRGEVSTRFELQPSLDGNLVLQGRFQLCDAGPLHILIEVGEVLRTRHRTAVVIPIHEPYFHYGINFLHQAIGGDFDPVLVFSDEGERARFAAMHQASPALCYRAIVAADHFSASAVAAMNGRRNWITSKKFLALYLLQDHYDRFCCVDAETFVISPTGWDQAARQTLEAATWHAGTSPTESEKAIVRHSALAMTPPDDHARLIEITADWTLFSWWWDLPVYAAAHLRGFFEWIDWRPTRASVSRYGFDAFDHLVYQFYTVLHEGFRIDHVGQINHSMEFARADLVRQVHEQVAPMHWTNAMAYAQAPDFFRENGYLAFYHIDRKTFPQHNP